MMNIKGSSFVIAVAVLCCVVHGARASEVVTATEASATPAAYVTPEYRDEAVELAPVVAMEVAATASTPAPAAADAAAAEDDGMLTLSMMEVGAHSEVVNFNELADEGTLQLSEEEQDAIVDSALDTLEVEFIRDYGSDSDVEQLNEFLAEDAAADEAIDLGSPRFAQTEAGAAAEARRRRRGRGGGGRGRKQAAAPGGAPPGADIAAQCARAGFTAGNTSPGGLAQQAGPNNSKKMGGGFFKKLGRGIKKFARKAGKWLKDRFGGGSRGPPGAPQPAGQGKGGMQQQQQQQMPGMPGPGGQPPAAGGKGWFGRMFDKVKAFGGKVGNKIGALSQKAGNFLNKIGAKNIGAKIKALGSKVKAWLNGKAVPPGTKGAIILPATSPKPMPGTPGGKGGPKITPGMPGTYQDSKGRWRGPSGKKVYTLEQQAIRKAERKAAKAAKRQAKRDRDARRAAKKAARDARRKAEYAEWASKDVAAHREWQEAKAHQKKMAALKAKKNRPDFTGVEADRPDRHERPHTAEEVEDCVTCRYVWLQVEMDIGDTTLEDNVYDSFTQNALEAQKAPIFYPGCQMMWDQIDDMMGDYMDGKTVNQICENSLMCRLANP